MPNNILDYDETNNEINIVYNDTPIGYKYFRLVLSKIRKDVSYIQSAFKIFGYEVPIHKYLYNSQYEIDANNITGVKGWKHVRHLPQGTTKWYSGTDNFNGTYILNDKSQLDNEEWSIPYSSDNTCLLYTSPSPRD